MIKLTAQINRYWSWSHFIVRSEEVPLYTPKGKRVQTASTQYPPGWHPTPATSVVNKIKVEKPKPAAGDKTKIKEKKEPSSKTSYRNDVEISEKLQDIKIAAPSTNDPTVELSKKLKRLRRRLRESEILVEKMEAGEITNPEKDQLEKIARRKEFEEEIEQLEAERLKMRQLKVNLPETEQLNRS